MRPEKQLLLDEIKEKIDSADAMLFTRYSGLSANATCDLRRQVREAGGDMEMVRKRVLVKAAAAAGIELDLEALEGHIAVVFAGEDAVGPTKAIVKFEKESEKTIQVIGGRFDGQMIDAASVKRISDLPDRDTMRSQLLGLFEAPMAQTLAVMEAILTAVPHCLQNKVNQENEG